LVSRFSLVAHPDFPPAAARNIVVDLVGGRKTARLTFTIERGEQVVLPTPALPTRADDLWRTTCFELFLMLDDDERYVEINLSPSTRWAAYAFDGYRDGRTALDIAAPRIERLPDGIAATLNLSALPHGELRMGLSAVVEETGDTLSYWALAHPPGAPDFHAAACFAARLPAPKDP
jgi:hypothetical protein